MLLQGPSGQGQMLTIWASALGLRPVLKPSGMAWLCSRLRKHSVKRGVGVGTWAHPVQTWMGVGDWGLIHGFSSKPSSQPPHPFTASSPQALGQLPLVCQVSVPGHSILVKGHWGQTPISYPSRCFWKGLVPGSSCWHQGNVGHGSLPPLASGSLRPPHS